MSYLFEQQPREGAKAFAAFKAYLDMGAERSLEAVAQKLHKSVTILGRWSAKYDWQARIKAHDVHLAELECKAIERVAVEKAVEWQRTHEGLRRQAWREAEETIVMVRQAREQWKAKGRTPGWDGMARMLELAFKLKQFAAGMPGEIKETHTQVTGKVSVEWEAAIRKAYGVVANAESLKPEMPKEEVVDVDVIAPQPSSGLRPPSPAPASEGQKEEKP